MNTILINFKEEIRNDDGSIEYGSGFQFTIGYCKKDFDGSGEIQLEDDVEKGTDILTTPIYQNPGHIYRAFLTNNQMLGFSLCYEQTPSEGRIRNAIFTLANEEIGAVHTFYSKATGNDFGANGRGLYLLVPFHWTQDRTMSLLDIADEMVLEYYDNRGTAYVQKCDDVNYAGLVLAEFQPNNSKKWNTSQTWGNRKDYFHGLKWASSWYKLIKDEFYVEPLYIETKDGGRFYLTRCLDDEYTSYSATNPEHTEWTFIEPVLGTELGYFVKNTGKSYYLANDSVMKIETERVGFSDIKFFSWSVSGELNNEPITILEKYRISLPVNKSSHNTVGYLESLRADNWDTTPDGILVCTGMYILNSPDYNHYGPLNITALMRYLSTKEATDWTQFTDALAGLVGLKNNGTDSYGRAGWLWNNVYYTNDRYFPCNFPTYGESTADSGIKWAYLLGLSDKLKPSKNPYQGGNLNTNLTGNGGNGTYDKSSYNVIGLTDGLGDQYQLDQYGVVSSNGYDGLIGLWRVNANNLGTYAGFMNSDAKILDGTIGIKYIWHPGNLSLGTNQLIYVNGTWATDGYNSANGQPTGRYVESYLGDIKIDNYYDNHLDIEDTTVGIYLPFSGFYELDTQEVMGARIALRCVIDVLTGSIVYNLTVEKDNLFSITKTYSGVCSDEIPLTAADWQSKIQSMLSAGVNAAVSVGGLAISAATGNPMGAVASFSSLAGAAGGIAQATIAKPNIKSMGIGGSSFGVLSPKYPFLIINRPDISLPDTESYAKVNGFPCTLSARIGSCEGYIEVADVHLEGLAGATSEEIDEIERLLKEGVIVS